MWQLAPGKAGGLNPGLAFATVESVTSEAAIAAAKISLVFMLYSFVIGMAIIRLHEDVFARNSFHGCFATQDYGFDCFSSPEHQISINYWEWDDLLKSIHAAHFE